MPGMTRIVDATSVEQLDHVRGLMRAFVAWHRGRHVDDLHLIDEYFDGAAFEAELASLPGAYAPPRGRLLLSLSDGEPAGCVALKELDERSCEMKRMFVDPALQGRGVGRALAEAVVREARRIGYRSMLLDTSIRQVEAIALYASLGFAEVEPYYAVPPSLRDWLVFMELPLDEG
jgi:GNAT superfamily N-acetyltransferase